MIFSLQNIILLLGRHKYAFLFPVAVIEGPIITVIAGFLVAQGLMSFWLAFWVVIIGDLAGDSILYVFGRWGRRLFRGRLGLWLGIDDAGKMDNFSEKFKEHGGKTLFMTKFTRGIGVIALITAGAARFSFWKFLWFNLLGTLPKTLGLLVLGYYFGQAYSQINSYLDYIAFITIIIALAGFFYYLWRRPSAIASQDMKRRKNV
jgi:membrane protein DedA with SNARE-associated domain